MYVLKRTISRNNQFKVPAETVSHSAVSEIENSDSDCKSFCVESMCWKEITSQCIFTYKKAFNKYHIFRWKHVSLSKYFRKIWERRQISTVTTLRGTVAVLKINTNKVLMISMHVLTFVFFPMRVWFLKLNEPLYLWTACRPKALGELSGSLS